MKRKIIIGFCALLVVIFVGGYAFLRSSFFLEKVRQIAESTLQSRFGRQVSVGAISGNVFRYLSIDGISIAKRDSLSEGELISADKIIMGYSLLSLLRWRFVIDDIRIIQPRIWLEMDEKGKLNLFQLLPPEDEAEKAGFLVVLSNVDISSGTVTFDDKKYPAGLVISGIDGSVRGVLDTDHKGVRYSGEIRSPKAEIKLGRMSKMISQLSLSFETFEDKTSLSDLRLRMGDSQLQANGELVSGKLGRSDIVLRSSLHLSDIREFFPGLGRLDGIATVNLKVSSDVKGLAGACEVFCPDAYVNNLNARDAYIKAKFTQDAITLTDTTIHLDKGSAKLTGSAQLAKGKLSKYNGQLKVDNLDIDRIMTDLKGPRIPLLGLLNGNLLINGKELVLGSFDISGQAELKESYLRLPTKEGALSPSSSVPIGTVRADVNVRKELISAILSRGETLAELRGKLSKNGDIDISIVADGLDIGEVASAFPGLPEVIGKGRVNASAGMKITDPRFLASMGLQESRQSGNLVKGIADLRAQATLDMPDLRLVSYRGTSEETGVSQQKEVRIGDLSCSVSLIDDNLRVDSLVLKLDESKCLVSADVKLGEPPSVDAILTLESLRIENYKDLVASPLNISGGLVNGKLELRGKINDVDGRGSISITGLSIGECSIEPMFLPIEIRSNVLRVPELVVESAGDQIKARFEFSQTGDYDVYVESSPLNIGHWIGMSGVKSLPNAQIGGTVQVSLSGRGNIKEPALKGKLNLKDIGYNGEYIGGGECNLSVGEGKAHMEVSFVEQTLSAEVDSSIRPPFPFSAGLHLQDFNFEPALKIAKIDEKADLRVTGDIKASGEAKNPMNVDMDAHLQSIVLGIGEHIWTNDQPIKFEFGERKFLLSSFEMKGAGGELSATGKVDVEDEEAGIDLKADVRDFDLSAISELVALPKPVTGRLNCTLSVSGGIGSPIVALRMDADRIAYEQVALEKLSSLISYKDGRLEVDKFSSELFDGVATMGVMLPIELDLRKLPTVEELMEKPIQGYLSTKGLSMESIASLVPEVLSAEGKIEGDLKVGGQIKHPEIDSLLSLNNVNLFLKSFPLEVEDLNGNLAVQTKEFNEGRIKSAFGASLGLTWRIETGEYNVKGMVQVPQDFLNSIFSSTPFDPSRLFQNLVSSIQHTQPDVQYPIFRFDMGIRNGQIGPFVKHIADNVKTLGPLPIDGSFSANLLAEGSIENPHGALTIDSLNLKVNNQEVKNVGQIKFAFADRTLEIPNLLLTTLAEEGLTGSIKMGGNVNFNDKSFEIALSGENLHPKLVSFLAFARPGSANNRDLGGNISFDFHSGGNLESPVIALSVMAKDVTVPVPSVSIQNVLPQDSQVALSSHTSEETSSKKAKEIKIDELSVKASYNGNMLDIENVNVKSFNNDLSVNGRLPIELSLMPVKVTFPDQGMDIGLATQDFDLAFLSQILDNVEGAKGKLSVNVRLSKSLFDPELGGNIKLSNFGSCVAVKKVVSGQGARDVKVDIRDMNLDITMEGKRLKIDTGTFSIGDGQYFVNGEAEFSAKYSPQAFKFSFKADPAVVDPFVSLIGEGLESLISGEVRIEGQLAGDLRDLKGKPIADILKSVSGNISIVPEGINVSAGEHKITNPSRIFAELKNGRLNLPSLKLVSGTPKRVNASRISALGIWEIGGEKRFDATVSVDTELISELLRKPGFMSGQLGFRVSARGEEVRIFWPLEDKQKLVVGNATIDEFEGELVYRDQEIKIDRPIWLSSGANKLYLLGSIPTSEKPLSCELYARLDDLGLLSLLNDDITESSGRGNIGVNITGNLKKIMAGEEPFRVKGHCRFDDLSANFERSNIKFEDIDVSLAIDFDSKRSPSIAIETFRGKMNDGEFVMDTSIGPGINITWDKETGYRVGGFENLAIALTDVVLYQPRVYSILLDSDPRDPIRLKGNFNAPLLTGSIIVKQGQYIESLDSLIQNLFATRDIGIKAFLDYPLVKDLELDMDVQIPQDMRMNNSLVNAEIGETYAKVRGSLVDPVVSARARIIEGSFSYFGRKFVITKGEFSNEGRIDPKYEIAAETEITNTGDIGIDSGSNLKVQMELKGSLSERLPPSFTLLGNGAATQQRPDLTQSDIIAILTLGSTLEAFSSRALTTSSPLLMEPAKWYFETQAEKYLGFKEFQLQIDPRDSKETRLVAEKQLLEQISVTLDVGYKGQQWIGLQREVGNHFALAGKVNQAGDWGFDLKLKQDLP